MCVSPFTLIKDPLTLQPFSFATIWVDGQREIKKGGAEVGDNKGSRRRPPTTNSSCSQELEKPVSLL
jgi:hypothetical protein